MIKGGSKNNLIPIRLTNMDLSKTRLYVELGEDYCITYLMNQVIFIGNIIPNSL